jgi:hypothetical protein
VNNPALWERTAMQSPSSHSPNWLSTPVKHHKADWRKKKKKKSYVFSVISR